MEPISITEAKYLDGYRLQLTFSDGLTENVDLENELWGEVFEPLKDLENFRKFKLNPFTIEWESGADFSPEFLYRLATKNAA